MEFVKLGGSGLSVSRLCLGCMTFGSPAWRPWVLEEAESRLLIRQALELGINFFDTADSYSSGASEEIVGRALADFAPRDEVVIATKVFFPSSAGPNGWGLSRKHILSAVDSSLKRLGVDYIDLYQIHRWDPTTPIEETVEALGALVSSGKVRYLGASSMFAWQLMKALSAQDRAGLPRFVSLQTQYNLIYREEEREVLPLCHDQRLGVMPWSPLARGLLAGSRSNGSARSRTDTQMAEWYSDAVDGPIVDEVTAVASKMGIPPAQVALSWLLSKPAVSAPIVGASKPGHLTDAMAALTIRLDPHDNVRLEHMYQPHPIVGHR